MRPNREFLRARHWPPCMPSSAYFITPGYFASQLAHLVPAGLLHCGRLLSHLTVVMVPTPAAAAAATQFREGEGFIEGPNMGNVVCSIQRALWFKRWPRSRKWIGNSMYP